MSSALIGAAAMAAHGYTRSSLDIDLALAVTLAELRRAAEHLFQSGYDTQLNEPDPGDPLGGVVDIDLGAGFPTVQLVNFRNSTRADDGGVGFRLGEAAIASGRPIIPGLTLRVVDLPT